jgi:hypothetical protein
MVLAMCLALPLSRAGAQDTMDVLGLVKATGTNGADGASAPTVGQSALQVQSGNGGAATTSGTGATGGDIEITSGIGGAGTGTSCNGGAGGQVTITAGNGASGGVTGGSGGMIYLNGGIGGAGPYGTPGNTAGVVMQGYGCQLRNYDGGLAPCYSLMTACGGVNSGGLSTYRARGTLSSLAAIQQEDITMSLQGWGYGTNSYWPYTSAWNVNSTIVMRSDGTPSSTAMPGRIEFLTTPSTGNQNVRRMTIKNDGQMCFGDTSGYQTYATVHIYDKSGAYMSQNGYWYNLCSRALKMNISNVAAADAWGLLDHMQVVDYEYKKQEDRVQMKDGRVLTYEAACAELNGQKGKDGKQIGFEEAGARTFSVRTDEGSGEWHRGFIAEDMPDKLVPPRRDGIAALDVAANNTVALQEAKRRILALEARVAGLEEIVAGKALLAADATLTTSGVLVFAPTSKAPDAAPDRAMVWAQRVGDVTELRAQNSTGDVAALTAHDATAVGWAEVAMADAMVEAPETQPVETTETVKRYRINWETKSPEAYEAQETVTKDVPTGKTILKLADGIRFDPATGKCWRWIGQ